MMKRCIELHLNLNCTKILKVLDWKNKYDENDKCSYKCLLIDKVTDIMDGVLMNGARIETRKMNSKKIFFFCFKFLNGVRGKIRQCVEIQYNSYVNALRPLAMVPLVTPSNKFDRRYKPCDGERSVQKRVCNLPNPERRRRGLRK